MTRRLRLKHTSAFKSKVALDALPGEHTLGKLARQYTALNCSVKPSHFYAARLCHFEISPNWAVFASVTGSNRD
jgi:hypothetical protein